MNTKKTARSLKNAIASLNLLIDNTKEMKMAGFLMLMNEDAVVTAFLV